MPSSSESFIQTYSGRKFDFENPAPESIALEDIAHALARICRFGGHISRYYSVADHSLNVARIVAWKGANLATVQAALFHDAQEAYLGDIVTPFKRMLPQAVDLERKLSAMILQKFGIGEAEVDFAAVKRADETMLVVEAKALFDFPPLEDWTNSFHAEAYLVPPQISRSQQEAEFYFLAAARLLLKQPAQAGLRQGWRNADRELPAVGQPCEVLIRSRSGHHERLRRAVLIQRPGSSDYAWANAEQPLFCVHGIKKWRLIPQPFIDAAFPASVRS